MKQAFLLLLTAIFFVVCTQSVAQEKRGINIVFIGNSITYGACHPQPTQTAPPVVVAELLRQRGTIGTVEIANLGVSGTTTFDWLPSGKFFKNIVDAGDKFAKSDIPLIFSIMLGTNDSACEGTNGAPVSDEQYSENLYIIIDTLLGRYPQANVVVHHPIWYSANTYNSARYLAEGQRRLSGYRRCVDRVVNEQFRAKDRGRVFVGDTEGWDYFNGNTPMFVQERGQAGTFMLHPNPDGSRRLAAFWEKHIYDIWLHESPEHVKLTSGAELLLYRAQGTSRDKAIVVCPGGGYEYLASEHEGTRMAHWYASMGITAAVLMYRMPAGDKSIPLQDAREAIEYMRSHASELGGYTKIGIMGSSAGGHLASTAATHLTGTAAPDFQILLYPVISMDESITHPGSRRNLLGDNPTDDDVRAFSNELQVTKSTPRAFIFLAGNDDLVPAANTLRYANALVEAGVSCTLHMYPTGGHGWGWSDGYFYKACWQKELTRWLEQF